VGELFAVVAGEEGQRVVASGGEDARELGVETGDGLLVGTRTVFGAIEAGADLPRWVQLPQVQEEEPGAAVGAAAQTLEQGVAPLRVQIVAGSTVLVSLEAAGEPHLGQQRTGHLGIRVVAGVGEGLREQRDAVG